MQIPRLTQQTPNARIRTQVEIETQNMLVWKQTLTTERSWFSSNDRQPNINYPFLLQENQNQPQPGAMQLQSSISCDSDEYSLVDVK